MQRGGGFAGFTWGVVPVLPNHCIDGFWDFSPATGNLNVRGLSTPCEALDAEAAHAPRDAGRPNMA